MSVVHFAGNLAWGYSGDFKIAMEMAKRPRKIGFDVIAQVANFVTLAEGRNAVSLVRGNLLYHLPFAKSRKGATPNLRQNGHPRTTECSMPPACFCSRRGVQQGVGAAAGHPRFGRPRGALRTTRRPEFPRLLGPGCGRRVEKPVEDDAGGHGLRCPALVGGGNLCTCRYSFSHETSSCSAQCQYL